MDPIKYLETLKEINKLNNFTLNGTEYEYIGEVELPLLDALEFWPYQVILVVLYSTTAFISLASNLVTIIVLVKGGRISTEIWKYLINLSISDISMSIFSIPFTYTIFMLNRWIFPTQWCPIVNFAQTCAVFVSNWTLTIIGIDRYNAIIHPLRQMSTVFDLIRKKKLLTIGLIWSFGILFGCAQLVFSRAIPFQYGDRIEYDCRETFDEYWGRVYTLVIFIATFALPMALLAFVYTTIGLNIWRNGIPGNPDIQRDVNHENRKEKVIKLLATIVFLFALCWLPIHIFTLLVWFYPSITSVQTKLQYRTYIWSYFACHFLSMGHSFVNPIVYCFMSKNFRNILCSIMRRRFSSIRHRRREPPIS